MKLPKPLKGSVSHELNYLIDDSAHVDESKIEEREKLMFKLISSMYDRTQPMAVRRQYTQSFAALNKMRLALGRKRIDTKRLPQFDHTPEGKP